MAMQPGQSRGRREVVSTTRSPPHVSVHDVDLKCTLSVISVTPACTFLPSSSAFLSLFDLWRLRSWLEHLLSSWVLHYLICLLTFCWIQGTRGGELPDGGPWESCSTPCWTRTSSQEQLNGSWKLTESRLWWFYHSVRGAFGSNRRFFDAEEHHIQWCLDQEVPCFSSVGSLERNRCRKMLKAIIFHLHEPQRGPEDLRPSRSAVSKFTGSAHIQPDKQPEDKMWSFVRDTDAREFRFLPGASHYRCP